MRIIALTSLLLLAPSVVAAQATCVDTTGDMCLNLLSTMRVDGVVNDIFQTSDGRYAPELGFATYVRGVNGCIGVTHTPTILSGYTCGAAGTDPPGGNDPAFQANSLDWYWTQVIRTDDSGAQVADGVAGFYYPWTARIYDLGGEANRVVLFPITDHDPLPCEAFEYAVFLTNNPDSMTIAPETAPDPNQWNRARLIRAFTEGWTRNPAATGAAEAGRADLGTHLRDASAGDAVADALATVWALPCGLTFRYAAIQAGNEGNPGPECAFHSSDDELDAVAGLNEDDTAICIDADGDGHRDAACGGSDCDDTNPDIHPGAFERCDATTDLDCRPMEACPEGTVCDTTTGLCSTQCFEGGCGPGFTCVGDRCLDAACAMRADPCPDGTLCREGACVAPCDGVVCPAGRLCAGGACIDPCLGVVCPTNQVCIAGEPGALTVCGPACTCDELVEPLCPVGEACETRMESEDFGHCVDPGCEALTCGPGEVCTSGMCIDGCAGVSCPLDQVCMDGECVIDRCASVVCSGSQVCRDGTCFDACDGVSCPSGQLCRDGACIPDPCFGITCEASERCVSGTCVPDGPVVDAGGTSMDAGTGRTDAGPGAVMDAGCGCRAAGGSKRGGLLLLLGWLALGVTRRRR
ncbi:MAG: putative metal-binding motif-containing protein [Sandaracinaceae bacterium]|nr:putative metal-binding motif-containing protein [Sandaracinaceae bacterium]